MGKRRLKRRQLEKLRLEKGQSRKSGKGRDGKRQVATEGLAARRALRRKVKKLTFGVTDALTNVALYLLYVTLEMPGGRGSAGVHRAFDEADRLITEFDAQRLRKALYNLQQQGLISALREAATLPRITEAGRRRLESVFPVYDAQRVWDKKLYLVVYDFPKGSNWERDVFRNVLGELKAIRLQRSVYLTPYNPREIIGEVVKERKIAGEILVSTLEPQNAFRHIGDIKDYLWEVYRLEEVNEQYELFIGDYRGLPREEARQKRSEIVFRYVAILREDPQLPFELLTDKYLGDEAYLLFRRLVRGKK